MPALQSTSQPLCGSPWSRSSLSLNLLRLVMHFHSLFPLHQDIPGDLLREGKSISGLIPPSPMKCLWKCPKGCDDDIKQGCCSRKRTACYPSSSALECSVDKCLHFEFKHHKSRLSGVSAISIKVRTLSETSDSAIPARFESKSTSAQRHETLLDTTSESCIKKSSEGPASEAAQSSNPNNIQSNVLAGQIGYALIAMIARA